MWDEVAGVRCGPFLLPPTCRPACCSQLCSRMGIDAAVKQTDRVRMHVEAWLGPHRINAAGLECGDAHGSGGSNPTYYSMLDAEDQR